MNKKGVKTSIVAIIAAILIIGLYIALFREKITGDEFNRSMPAITAAAVVIIGLLSKDQDSTHTKS